MADVSIRTPAGQKLADRLTSKYCLSLDDYRALVEKQDGRCAVCRSSPKPGQRLHVDHDHHTGEVRGLLCAACNVALGLMDERGDLIHRLATYAVHAAMRRDEVRREPRAVLGVPHHFRRHPLTRLFERVPDKTQCAKDIVATITRWRREVPQRSLGLE